jgi:hypothetical protein
MPKVETVKGDAIIDLKIGSKFLQDLQGVLIYISNLQATGRIQETVNKVNTQGEDSLDEWESSIYTMLVLITTIEENARTAGLTVIEEIPEEGLSPATPE